MSYSNYGGQDFTGVDHVRLLDGFKRLRASGYIAKGNIQAGEGQEMKTRLGTRLPNMGLYNGAIWWEARDENQTWPRDGGYQTASNPGLYIRCMGHQSIPGVNTFQAPEMVAAGWDSMAVAEEAIKVLRGLSPIIVETPGSERDRGYRGIQDLAREYEVIIYCPPMTRLEDMTEEIRQAKIAGVQREAEALARMNENDIQRAIHTHADVLCDQGILRMTYRDVPQDVVEFTEAREARIEQHLNSYPMGDQYRRTHLASSRPADFRWTTEEVERIKRDGASLAQERLRAMLTDVNERLDEAHFSTLPNLG